jgi:vancomycin resistance protein YoaR
MRKAPGIRRLAGMKKLLIVLLSTLVGISGALSVVAWRFEARVEKNVLVGIVPVGGLTPEDAAKRLRIWWESVRTKTLVLKSSVFGSDEPTLPVSKLGISLDDAASVKQLPTDDFWETAKGVVAHDEPQTRKFDLVFRSKAGAFKALKEVVEDACDDGRPATVKYVDGDIERTPEVAGYTLDESKVLQAIEQALIDDSPVDVPIAQAPKKVSDEDLNQITDIVSQFSTRFPRRMASRNSNIRTAADKLDGVVLAPGEKLSFNETVGQRTIENGFKLAGVYKAGKHDLGVGGGICQVSSTLYNAVLLGDLKVVRRQNHSMPVAYLPVGRDATVNYGSIDFVFENTLPTPIAVSSSYTPGRLTFRILGKKDPSVSVKIISVGHRSWDTGVQTVVDPTLPVGKRVVKEKGSRGHSVSTYRLVFKNGVQVAREFLGRSFYKGGVRIIAVGSRKVPPAVSGAVSEMPRTVPAPEDGGDR